MNFDYVICYEDRDAIWTSRWNLAGVRTIAGGNTDGGWLWMRAGRTGETVTVSLYKDEDCAVGDKVAAGTADVSSLPARCLMSQANTSGLSGEVYIEEYAGDPAGAVPVLVSLCVDADLAIEYGNLSDLPAFSATAGLADYCATATRKVLLLASQLFAGPLGGANGPEHRNLGAADRAVPDFRRLANPDQLKEAAVHWALMLAFGRSHERAEKTMYSERRDYHDRRRQEAIGAWNLTFNADPDADSDAEQAGSARAVRVTRL